MMNDIDVNEMYVPYAGFIRWMSNDSVTKRRVKIWLDIHIYIKVVS